MIAPALAERAQQLQTERRAFVTATVVRAQSPTSAEPGDVALVLADGTVEGFVGGVCAEASPQFTSTAHGLSGPGSVNEPRLKLVLAPSVEV